MEEDRATTQWNSNRASLQRVDDLMKKCHSDYYNELWDSLFKNLRSLRVEARYKMDKQEKEDCDKNFNKLNNTRKMFLDKKDTNKKLIDVYAQTLDMFWVFLTDFMGDRGMLLTDAEDDDGL